MKAPNGRRLLRGVAFVMHEPVVYGGIWMESVEAQQHLERLHGVGSKAMNDTMFLMSKHLDALQLVAGWTCADCGTSIAIAQPWCGCGADFDWQPERFTLHETELDEADPESEWLGKLLVWVPPAELHSSGSLFKPHGEYRTRQKVRAA